MSDQPKVSERMRQLAEAFRSAGNCSYCNMDSGECRCGWERTAAKTDISTKREALLSAIAEIEQRAEKWKEVAVAYQKWRDAYFKWEPDERLENPQVHLDLEAAQDRLEAATAALGDEWDRAVG